MLTFPHQIDPETLRLLAAAEYAGVELIRQAGLGAAALANDPELPQAIIDDMRSALGSAQIAIGRYYLNVLRRDGEVPAL